MYLRSLGAAGVSAAGVHAVVQRAYKYKCLCLAGSYRPSYEVMLRFYSLYKQAVCGPCTVARPGFWDPVGRYKWSVCVCGLVCHCDQSQVGVE